MLLIIGIALLQAHCRQGRLSPVLKFCAPLSCVGGSPFVRLACSLPCCAADSGADPCCGLSAEAVDERFAAAPRPRGADRRAVHRTAERLRDCQIFCGACNARRVALAGRGQPAAGGRVDAVHPLGAATDWAGAWPVAARAAPAGAHQVRPARTWFRGDGWVGRWGMKSAAAAQKKPAEAGLSDRPEDSGLVAPAKSQTQQRQADQGDRRWLRNH